MTKKDKKSVTNCYKKIKNVRSLIKGFGADMHSNLIIDYSTLKETELK